MRFLSLVPLRKHETSWKENMMCAPYRLLYFLNKRSYVYLSGLFFFDGLSSYWKNSIDDDKFSLQESSDQLIYKNVKLKKSMTKINNNLKEKDKEHLDLSDQLLILTLEGEKDVGNLKMKLDNHIKSLQIIF